MGILKSIIQTNLNSFCSIHIKSMDNNLEILAQQYDKIDGKQKSPEIQD